MTKIYVDHAAATPVRQEVLQAMLPFFTESFGNASSIHSFGQEARIAVERSRRAIAGALFAKPGEILFTSGGTESDNWGIRMGALSRQDRGKHLLTTRMEHPAVLRTFESLEKAGFEVTYLPVSREGQVSPESLKEALREDTVLVSCQMVNNEVGSLTDFAALGAICRERGILFHVDAVQGLGKVPINLKELPVDLMSFSGHKIYGPKGIGALYIREKANVPALILGGSQERDLRAGTENVPGILGFARAAELAAAQREESQDRVWALQERLVRGILREIPGVHFNGPLVGLEDGIPIRRPAVPGYVNLRFDGVEGESLLVLLDMKGVAASAGSACSSGSTEPSHVLRALGLSAEQAGSSLRFTLGEDNTPEEMDQLILILSESVAQLRRIRGVKLP